MTRLVTVTIPAGVDVTLDPGEIIRYCDDNGLDCWAEVVAIRAEHDLLLATLALDD